MFGFGKTKEVPNVQQQDKSALEQFRKCIEYGLMPIQEMENGVPVLFRNLTSPLYEIKPTRVYAGTRLAKGFVAASKGLEGWTHTDNGKLSITPKGIFFYGNKTTIHFERSKILNVYAVFGQKKNEITGLKVHVSNRKNPVIFGVTKPDFTAELTLFALNQAPNWKIGTYDSQMALIDANKHQV